MSILPRPVSVIFFVAAILATATSPASAQSTPFTVKIRFGDLNTDCYPSCSHATEWLQQLHAEVSDSAGLLVSNAALEFDWGVEYCNGNPFQYGFATGIGLDHLAVDGNLAKNEPGCCTDCAHQSYRVGVRVKIDEWTISAQPILVPSIPLAHSMQQNYPNPFNDRTRIPFELKEQARVRLDILDLQGRLIVRLIDRPFAPGRHAVDWIPRDVASGMYLCRISFSSSRDPGTVVVGKMLYGK